MNSAEWAMASGVVPSVRDTRAITLRTVSAMWVGCRRVPWKALLTMVASNSSAMGLMPRSAAVLACSSTTALAPMPRMRPWRRASNGRAVSSTTSFVLAAPAAMKPPPIQRMRFSLVTLSALTTMTRLQRPTRIQSWAMATPWVADAHAAFTAVFGPRAPSSWASWL